MAYLKENVRIPYSLTILDNGSEDETPRIGKALEKKYPEVTYVRIPKVVMGCRNPKAGCGGSVLNILQEPKFNHQVEITEGVLEKECSALLTDFFKELRYRNKREKEIRWEQKNGKNTAFH